MYFEDGASDTVHLKVDSREHVFDIQVRSKPLAIMYDPEGTLIWSVVLPELTSAGCRRFIQEENSWITRNAGVEYLIGHLPEFSFDDIRVALRDSNWYLRHKVLVALDLNAYRGLEADVVNVTQSDPDPRVRLAAYHCVGNLGESSHAWLFIDLLERGQKVEELVTGLEQLLNCDPKAALHYANVLEHDPSLDVQTAVAGVYSQEGLADYRAFFRRGAPVAGVKGPAFYDRYAHWIVRQPEHEVMAEMDFLSELALSTRHDRYSRFYSTYVLWLLWHQTSNLPGLRMRAEEAILTIRRETRDSVLLEWYTGLD
jgi:hypothetical protein